MTGASQRNPKQQSSIGLTDDDHIVIVYPRYGSFGKKIKRSRYLLVCQIVKQPKLGLSILFKTTNKLTYLLSKTSSPDLMCTKFLSEGL